MIQEHIVHMFIDSEGKAVRPSDILSDPGGEIFPLHRVTETTVHFDSDDGGSVLIVFTHRLGHMVQS